MAARMKQLGMVMEENGTANYVQFMKYDMDRYAAGGEEAQSSDQVSAAQVRLTVRLASVPHVLAAIDHVVQIGREQHRRHLLDGHAALHFGQAGLLLGVLGPPDRGGVLPLEVFSCNAIGASPRATLRERRSLGPAPFGVKLRRRGRPRPFAARVSSSSTPPRESARRPRNRIAFGIAGEIEPGFRDVQKHGALGGRARGLRDLDAFLGAFAIVGHGHSAFSPDYQPT